MLKRVHLFNREDDVLVWGPLAIVELLPEVRT
jgi:hypothetical protein